MASTSTITFGNYPRPVNAILPLPTKPNSYLLQFIVILLDLLVFILQTVSLNVFPNDQSTRRLPSQAHSTRNKGERSKTNPRVLNDENVKLIECLSTFKYKH